MAGARPVISAGQEEGASLRPPAHKTGRNYPAYITGLDDALKRLFDMAASLVGVVLLSPLLAVIAIAVKAQDGGPVFYRATRIGKHGRPFRLYKFRTMITGADKIGPGITAGGDARVTRAGRWLRRTKLDELPQLINVLSGDMSLVGPRPEDPRYVALYTPEQRKVLQVRPGITSAASLAYRREEQMLAGVDWEATYLNQVMPAKLEIDLNYLANRSSWSDLVLIIQTVTALSK
jgi:lipopolysaccharide/colanic/teichoic acid biosynthesis glycosyltransferase